MSIKKILFFMVLFLIPIVKINAASFNVSASSRNVTVGSNVTVYVQGNDVTGKVNITSSDPSILSSGTNTLWIEPSGSVTFNAKKEGSATINVSSASLSDGAGNDINLGSKSITINVTAKTAQKELSSNNSLKSLSVEGYELSPAFEPGTTEYNVNVKKGTTSVSLKATSEDSNSSINGTGNIQVSEGLNPVKIVVTAENGYTKEYLLNIMVEEDPIVFKIKDKEFNLVKQVEALPQVSSFYTQGTMEYKYKEDGEEKSIELPTYTSDITGYTLVAAKDDKGKINLYIYDKGKFTLYQELSFNNNIVLYQKSAKNIPNGYKKVNITINNQEVIAYQNDNKSDYYLIYGMNVDSGNTGWYKYDKIDNSIQRYDNTLIDKLNKENKKYLTTLYVFSGISLFLLLSIIILLIKIRNIKR